MKNKQQNKAAASEKDKQLEGHSESGENQFLTTNHGLKINDNQHSLKAGERGPSLLEDFILREKITHFDHERIPERIVHARGSAAHGHFQVYESMSKYTKAGFLQDPAVKTPVYVRFSTVAGSRGSSDLARDARGFAVKFYTQEGNYDLVGNNVPVFFIQDALKFPDLIHAVKPEPHNEMPQAASAHDTFWDFISLMPESMHMIMWVMSDRAIPRSYRMMEGFGVHTFRFVNENNESHFVKFHWKPLLGVHSVAWNEAQKISGFDPDFHRRDLWDAIENQNYPEWELGVQLIKEEDEHKFDFDLLDPTKLVPEEIVPVIRIGKMTLDRNPDNFFAETEQVAFHPGHLVPGIDFTNDPLLQGRLFSYTDTQLIRLGGPNFHEIPINRPVAEVHNNQRDGHMRQTINKGRVSYEPNTLGGGCPFQAKMEEGGFTSYPEKVEAKKIRGRSRSFFDHYSQAGLFFRSQSEPEKKHLISALSFELSKVETAAIRERMLLHLNNIDKNLTEEVARNLGMDVPVSPFNGLLNGSIPADETPGNFQSIPVKPSDTVSEALSMANTVKDSVAGRVVAILIANGVDTSSVDIIKKALGAKGASGKLIAPSLGPVAGLNDQNLTAEASFFNTSSVLYDAVIIPGGNGSIKILSENTDALHFINEAYRHCKTIALEGAETLLRATYLKEDEGVILIPSGEITQKVDAFIKAVAGHRVWDRELARKVPS
jgi:catalase